MPFKLTPTPADVQHVNLRKEGPDDDKIRKADVKLFCSRVPADLLRHLFAGNTKPGHIPENDGSHWRLDETLYDDEGHPKFFGLPPLTTDHQFDNYRVRIGSREYRRARVSKFVAVIRDERRIDLTFSAAIELGTGDADYLSELNQESASVSFEPEQGGLFDAAGEVKKAAAGLAQLAAADGVDSVEITNGGGDGVRIEKGGDIVPIGNARVPEAEDPLYPEAVKIARAHGTFGISKLQRLLKVGYNRAARLCEDMEANGVATRGPGGSFHVKPTEGADSRSLAHLPGKAAIEIALQMDDVATLEWLLQTENRATVKSAIQKRLDEIKVKP